MSEEQQAQQETTATEEPSTTTQPVIRPAVTLPNPDSHAPQMDPSDTIGPDTAPTAATSTVEEDEERSEDLYTLPTEVVEPAPERGALPVLPEPEAAPRAPKRSPLFRRTQPTRRDPDTAEDEAAQNVHTQHAKSKGLKLPPLRPNRGEGATSQPSAPTQRPPRREMPTQVMNLVNRLETSPFAAAARKEYQKAAESSEVRNTLEFAMKLGETMFRFGAGALEVETSIIVITQAYGVHETEIDITNQSFSLNFAPPGEAPYTLQRVVRSWSQNFAGLAQLHQLVSTIASGDTSREDAERQLAEIRLRRKPFRAWMTVISSAFFASAFVMYIGGSPLAGLVTLIATSAVMMTMNGMAKLRVPEFFTVMSGAFVATVVSLGLYSLDVFMDPASVVAGILMIMLPSGRFVSAVQDGINGFPITAAGRFVSALLTYAALVGGIVVAVVLASGIGVPPIDLTREPTFSYPVWLLGLLVFFASAMVAATEQSGWQMLIPTGLVSLFGFVFYELSVYLGLGSTVSPAVAACAMGFLGRMVALRMGAPQLVIAVPSVLFLLPGLTIFRSMYEIAMDAGAVGGVVGFFYATLVIMAVAAGSVLGDTLARPLTTKLQGNERRRIGRR